jgi:hypothetical protein
MKAVPLVVLCALIIAVPSVWAYWVQDGVALCTATGEQFYPMITSDGDAAHAEILNPLIIHRVHSGSHCAKELAKPRPSAADGIRAGCHGLMPGFLSRNCGKFRRYLE